LVPEKGRNPGFPPPDEPPWTMEKMMFFQQTGLRELHKIKFKNYPLFLEGIKHTVVYLHLMERVAFATPFL
jgi:hypothetical protein